MITKVFISTTTSNNAVIESQPNSKFKIDSSLKPTTNDSYQPKPPNKRGVAHPSLSDSNKKQKTESIEPRQKNFRFDVEILFANDTKHHM